MNIGFLKYYDKKLISKAIGPEGLELSLRTNLADGITWNVIGAVFTQGSGFLVNIILANFLGRDLFGEFGMINSTLLTFFGIAQVATGVTATKYVAEFRSTDKERTGRILGLCSAIAFISAGIAILLLIAYAPWLASNTLKAPHLARSLMIGSAFVAFAVINGYQMGALAGLESYHALTRAGAIQGALHLIICSLTTWLWKLEGAVVGIAVSACARWLIFHAVMRHETAKNSIEIRYHKIWGERRIIMKFALPIAMSSLFSMPAIWLAHAFLVRQDDGFSQMGLYSAAYTLRTAVLFLPVLFNNVGMSLLNNQKGMGDETRYREIFWLNLSINAGAVVLGIIAIAILGVWLLQLFGKDFVEGYSILLWLLVAAFFEALATATNQIILCQEKMWLAFFVVGLPRDLMIALLAYFLIPLHGAIGLAFSCATAWAFAFCAILLMAYIIGLKTHHSQETAAY